MFEKKYIRIMKWNFGVGENFTFYSDLVEFCYR